MIIIWDAGIHIFMADLTLSIELTAIVNSYPAFSLEWVVGVYGRDHSESPSFLSVRDDSVL